MKNYLTLLKKAFFNAVNSDDYMHQSLNAIEEVKKHTEWRGRMESLRYHAVHDTADGTTSERYCPEEVIVSLTTYGARIHQVYLTIESIFEQTRLANRVILQLAKDEFEGYTLPMSLQKLQKRGLEIRYCDDLGCYKKLYPTRLEFPEACIITVDDDMIYAPDFVDRLVHAHLETPKVVCAMNAATVQWFLHERRTPSAPIPDTQPRWLFACGGSGTLYPPDALYSDALNQDLFTRLAPHEDDTWWCVMELLQGTKVRRLSLWPSDGGMQNPEVQSRSLNAWRKSSIDGHLEEQRAVLKYYGIDNEQVWIERGWV